MKFLSTWLRNSCRRAVRKSHSRFLNEVPEHMAQESDAAVRVDVHVESSMKFLSTWLRNRVSTGDQTTDLQRVLNEVPEHMAQEYLLPVAGPAGELSSTKFLST